MKYDPMRQEDIERRLANMAKAPRCGARTRTGRPCRQAAVIIRSSQEVLVKPPRSPDDRRGTDDK